jgi:hypothetical protein
MKIIIHIFIFLLGLLVDHHLSAQGIQDSTGLITPQKKEKKGSIFSGRPGKAMLMSLVVPGAGQIYNKSYLRVPFVWGAVGGFGWWMIDNTRQYRCYRDAYIQIIDGTPFNLPEHCKKQDGNGDNIPDIEQVSASVIRNARDEANKMKQTSILIFGLVWLANGVDAFVDAHLKDFDINEDLSLEIGTHLGDDPYAPMQVGIYVQF